MKTIQEFMEKVNDYFGGFQNETVADMFAQELKYIKPTDYDFLFRQIAVKLPASWKPDYKSLVETIRESKIEQLNDPSSTAVCPVCRTVNHSTGVCPSCCYDGLKDGTPEEYRAWWESWKAGKEPRYNVAEMLKGLAEKKAVME